MNVLVFGIFGGIVILQPDGGGKRDKMSSSYYQILSLVMNFLCI